MRALDTVEINQVNGGLTPLGFFLGSVAIGHLGGASIGWATSFPHDKGHELNVIFGVGLGAYFGTMAGLAVGAVGALTLAVL